jgi:hypothetical protein
VHEVALPWGVAVGRLRPGRKDISGMLEDIARQINLPLRARLRGLPAGIAHRLRPVCGGRRPAGAGLGYSPGLYQIGEV